MTEYDDQILRTILVITGNREISEEITQEVFLRAWRKRRQFRWESSPKSWLYRIAVNLARNNLRKRTERPVSPEIAERQAGAAPQPGPDRLVEDRVSAAEVRRAVAELSDDLREVVALYYLDDLRVHEVGAVLGLPAGTVKSRLSRARGRLRAQLAEWGETDEG